MSELELMKDYVLITKEEFKEYCLLKDEIEKEISFEKNLNSNKAKLLDGLFREDRMGYDSRREQLNLESSYCGFAEKSIEFLRSLGFKDDDLKKYINFRWDKKEQEEKEEENAED